MCRRSWKRIRRSPAFSVRDYPRREIHGAEWRSRPREAISAAGAQPRAGRGPLEPEDLALAHPGPRGQRDQVQPLRVPPLAGAEEGRKLGLGERCDRGARFLFRPPPVEPREARRRVERNEAILHSVVHDLSEEGDDL